MSRDHTVATRTLAWDGGRAELQRLGGMLGPVWFSAPGRADFAPLQVAPWADEPGADALPGILRRLRGEWTCVPFGRTDLPAGLPLGWGTREPGDAWGHGYASNHEWQWLATADPRALALTIEPPGPLRRLTRIVRATPGAPELLLTLEIEVREPCTLPIALHPTLRLDAGAVRLELPPHGAALSYPVPAEPGESRLVPGRAFDRLECAPCSDGSTLDLTRYPLPHDTEELLQLRDVDGPVSLHYLDAGWTLQLDWDHRVLPDLMLWVSHRGRAYPPWNGRHLALGVEPVHGVFDLGRVATPPPGHPLADRRGVQLVPDVPLTLNYRMTARPA
jgi:hypothetical protein